MPNLKKILDNATNVASLLSEEKRQQIGSKVVEDFKKDDNSRAEWTDRNKESMKLALQITEQKTWPWTGAANVKYPLLTTAAIQFASRVELFASDNDIVKGKVVGFDPDGSKTDRAIRIGKHMSYQLSEEMDDWDVQNDKMFHALPIIGTMFKKTYFDPVKGRNCSHIVFPQHLVFDYWAEDVEKAFRKTHLLFLSPNQIQERINYGLFLDIDLPDLSGFVSRELSEEVDGTSAYQDDDAPRCFLEQHTFLDLDEDGYKEPYIITVDRESELLVRIVPRFYSESIQSKGKKVLRIEPDEYFTQFTFIPNPNGGNLGLGLGHFLGPINETVNTVINQLLDAGTLANLQSGFIGKGIRIKGGMTNFQPGEWKQVPTTGEDLQKNIVPLPTKDPSQVLFTLLELMVSAGEKLGSVTDPMVGENPPANQAATTTLSTIEQGTKVFKRIHKRQYRSFTSEFKKVYKLNGMYLPNQSYFDVLDIPPDQIQKLLPVTQDLLAQSKQMLVLPDDYEVEDIGVVPTSDPNVTTQSEKMQKAQFLLETIQLWPPDEVKRRLVEAMGIPNADALLVPMEPPPDPKIELEKMKLQLEQAKFENESQLKQMEFQFKQAEMEIEIRKMEAEHEKLQMEIAKIEAEIRKTMAEIEAGADNQIDQAQIQLDAQKMIAEHEVKMKEIELKEQELALKNKEIEVNKEVALTTNQQQMEMKQQEGSAGNDKMAKMMGEVHAHVTKPKGKMSIKRNKEGFIESVGNRRIKRDAKGQAVEIEETEDD